MSSPPRLIDIHASFAGPAEAEAAITALRDAGIRPSSIHLEHNILPEPRQREARFLWRVLLVIFLWSIAGALFGAAFGLLLALTIGPEGASGRILQVVCWLIVGHLIGGMLAGYFLLADRTQREMPPDRPISLLTVGDLDPRQATGTRRLLRSHRALEVGVSQPRSLPAGQRFILPSAHPLSIC